MMVPEKLEGGAKAIAATAFALFMYKTAVQSIIGAMMIYGYWSVVSAMLSVPLVFFIRWTGGGMSSIKREARAVYDDWTHPFVWIMKAHKTPWLDLYREGIVTFACLPMYSQYGPLTMAFVDAYFVTPASGGMKLVKFLSFDGLASVKISEVAFIVTIMSLGYAITHNGTTISHRFFAHRGFIAGRFVTYFLACWGSLGAPPMWWAAIHRRHHRHTDEDGDPHSPVRKGFFYAYLGWQLDRDNYKIRLSYIRDWVTQYPELLLVDFFKPKIRYFIIQAVMYPLIPLGNWWFGEELPRYVVVNAYVLGQIMAVHMALLFNAYTHGWETEVPDTDKQPVGENPIRGKYEADDSSETKNIGTFLECVRSRTFLAKDIHRLGFISAGEAYHMRHHNHPRLAQLSPYWWEDWAMWVINPLEWCGLAWDVKKPETPGIFLGLEHPNAKRD